MPAAAFTARAGVDRAGALGEAVVAEVLRRRLQDAPRRAAEVRRDRCPGAPCATPGRRARSRAAATGVERLVPPHVSHAMRPSRAVLSVSSPGGVGAVGDDVDAGRARRARPAVREQAITSLSATWPMRAIESQPVPPNCVDAPTLTPATGDGDGRRAVAGRAVARENSGVAAEPVVDDVGLLAGGVVAVVVDVGVAVGVRRHVDAGRGREQVAELGRGVEAEVDVAVRRELGVRRAADDGARVAPVARAGPRSAAPCR